MTSDARSLLKDNRLLSLFRWPAPVMLSLPGSCSEMTSCGDVAANPPDCSCSFVANTWLHPVGMLGPCYNRAHLCLSRGMRPKTCVWAAGSDYETMTWKAIEHTIDPYPCWDRQTSAMASESSCNSGPGDPVQELGKGSLSETSIHFGRCGCRAERD